MCCESEALAGRLRDRLSEKAWQFHTCVVCGSKLEFGTDSAKTGPGVRAKERGTRDGGEGACARTRLRYRAEVLDLGFKIERPK